MEEKVSVVDNIKMYYDQLFSAEKKVADGILANVQEVVMMNVSELANHSGVSEATVVRMCKHIGYQGYYQMRLLLAHDLGKGDRSSGNRETMDSLQRIFDRSASNISNLAERIDLELMIKCAARLKKSRMVYVVAAGNTTPIALDLGFRLERFGIPCSYGIIPEHFLNHVSLGRAEDTLIAISGSGTSKPVLQAMELAQKVNMQSIAITAEEYSPLSKNADYVLSVQCKEQLFPSDMLPASHLCKLAVSDALLYVVRNLDVFAKELAGEQDNEYSDEVELLLSEYKL